MFGLSKLLSGPVPTAPAERSASDGPTQSEAIKLLRYLDTPGPAVPGRAQAALEQLAASRDPQVLVTVVGRLMSLDQSIAAKASGILASADYATVRAATLEAFSRIAQEREVQGAGRFTTWMDAKSIKTLRDDAQTRLHRGIVNADPNLGPALVAAYAPLNVRGAFPDDTRLLQSQNPIGRARMCAELVASAGTFNVLKNDREVEELLGRAERRARGLELAERDAVVQSIGGVNLGVLAFRADPYVRLLGALGGEKADALIVAISARASGLGLERHAGKAVLEHFQRVAKLHDERSVVSLGTKLLEGSDGRDVKDVRFARGLCAVMLEHGGELGFAETLRRGFPENHAEAGGAIAVAARDALGAYLLQSGDRRDASYFRMAQYLGGKDVAAPLWLKAVIQERRLGPGLPVSEARGAIPIAMVPGPEAAKKLGFEFGRIVPGSEQLVDVKLPEGASVEVSAAGVVIRSAPGAAGSDGPAANRERVLAWISCKEGGSVECRLNVPPREWLPMPKGVAGGSAWPDHRSIGPRSLADIKVLSMSKDGSHHVILPDGSGFVWGTLARYSNDTYRLIRNGDVPGATILEPGSPLWQKIQAYLPSDAHSREYRRWAGELIHLADRFKDDPAAPGSLPEDGAKIVRSGADGELLLRSVLARVTADRSEDSLQRLGNTRYADFEAALRMVSVELSRPPAGKQPPRADRGGAGFTL